jgi:formylglycine-generating enzyme required for sulfatase activity
MAGLPGGSEAPFCLDVAEVTVEDYARCVAEGACQDTGRTVAWTGITDEDRARSSQLCNTGRAGRSQHPMNCVEWDRAAAYCQARGKRLPSPKEWSWAASGADRPSAYPWGNEAPGNRVCWSGGDVKRTEQQLGTCPVGTNPGSESPQGVKDLVGNVWEWNTDGGGYDGRPARSICGGGWEDSDSTVLMRSWGIFAEPEDRRTYIGFRCALTP